MSNTYRILQLLFIIVFSVNLVSCKKYLDTKSDESLSIPNSVGDLQALLDNGTANYGMQLSSIGTDEYYLLDADWSSFNSYIIIYHGYIWNDDVKLDLTGSDWNRQYYGIMNVNTVLDYVDKIPGSQEKKDQLKGAALFYRARMFFDLAQVYAPHYDGSTTSDNLGMPLRLTSDFNKKVSRASVKETYERIISDLQDAVELLPDVQPNTDLYKARPTKTAAYALLARIYLAIEDYDKARQNADLSLQSYSTLLDYNSIDTTKSYPFVRYNPEQIFYTKVEATNGYDFARTDSLLYQLYSNNDIRRAAFFQKNSDGTKSYKGSYNGDNFLFTGLTTAEMYLIRAECYARANNVTAAIQDLNTLLSKRYKSGTFVSLSATTPEEALILTLNERRKELINRGTRWSDLRRLNKDSRLKTTLKRKIAGQTYSLVPEDLRYTWLIPQEIINISGIQQNPR